ncbi:MAG: CoB--CoM heterodisulfide reductase iron-sulfur subunit B family protein [Pseudomonadota bacterium]
MAETYWKEYLYYPGCSLHSSSKAYDASSRVVSAALGAKLVELEDWNCCGATAYMGIKELTAFAISARNLALAEQKSGEIVAPCSGCYVGLNKTNNYLKEFPQVRQKVNAALSEGGLSYKGTVKVRHLLDVFAHDIGPEKVRQFVVRPLEGLKVGCYYGCQVVRPKNEIDDPECPETMEGLMRVCGATPVDFAMKANCCGGALMGTEEWIGLRLIKNLLHSAIRSGAQILVTPCPLCQLNIDAYQQRAAKKYKMKFDIPILYFTQLIGLALGLSPADLGIGQEIVSANDVLAKYMK